MKQIFALVVAFSITTTAFSQAGQKWSTSGNATTSGDFIGSTNNEPLIFKTNNNHQGMFTASGDFQLTSLKGMGFSLLQTDALGIVSKFPMSNSNEILYGDGVWRPLPTTTLFWQQHGTDLFYLSGKVGIGTNTPFTNFDVIGDAYISNNLYVGGGIIITEKINANKEVLTATLRADSIIMDSTKAVYGYSVFKDQVRLENKLQVVGNTQIDGNLRLNGDFIFGNNKRISYLPPLNGEPEVIGFGGQPLPPSAPCFPTIAPTVNQFKYMLQAWGYSNGDEVNGNLNIMSMGYDGANGIIDMQGNNSNGDEAGLLINYYCGRDIHMNTGANGGNVIMTSASLGNVGIGTSTPTAKLDVVGSFRLNNGSEGANKVLVSDANGVASWQDPSTIEDGDWTINATDIYRLTGNVGIGTTTPTQALDINGVLRVGDGNSNFLDIWYDDAHNIIDAKGADLLINYYENKNCAIGPGSLTASGIFTAQKDAYFATSSGNVGIGTTTPTAKLEVNGTLRVGDGNTNYLDIWYDDAHNIIDAKGADLLINYYANNNCVIGPGALTASGVFTAQKDAYFATTMGSVGIGTTKTMGYKLSVEGKMRAREIEVNASTWADFVFADNYQLKPLNEVEKYIDEKRHLPNVPSEKEVLEKGINLGEMDAILLQKIEELTLYIIDLEKRLKKLEH